MIQQNSLISVVASTTDETLIDFRFSALANSKGCSPASCRGVADAVLDTKKIIAAANIKGFMRVCSVVVSWGDRSEIRTETPASVVPLTPFR
ncbi:hypothetical protein [Aquimonas sp.]|uniref:hypothetical protein n=1 Tax=Aquimonas sp. TaxID=1872588 RepID=UPI0037BEA052